MVDAVEEQDHVVQFYQTDEFLTHVVAPFLGTGLRREGPILVVCTAEQFSVISRGLTASGLDPAHPRRRNLVVWRDARILLEQLQIDGEISEAAFDREVGQAVSDLRVRSSAKPLHVFGGLVDLLWALERTADALLLEDLWRALSEKHQLNLICSYRVAACGHRAPLRALGVAHSHVLERRRDRRIADGLREELAQSLFGLLMMGESIRARVPDPLKTQVEELIRPLSGILKSCLAFSKELAPSRLQLLSLPRVLQTYAATMQQLFGITCVVMAGGGVADPDLTQQELLCALVREVVDRAVAERGARHVTIELSRRAGFERLVIRHDGEHVAVDGGSNERFRRLIFEARSLGNKLTIGAAAGRPQLTCRWRAGRERSGKERAAR